MKKKEFVYTSASERICYINSDGDKCYLYIDNYKKDKDITIEKIEADFDNLVKTSKKVMDNNVDSPNRKDLFIFIYAVAKGWIK